MGVGQVAVVRHREPAELEIGIQRLDIAQNGFAGRRIAVVPDGIAPRQPRHRARVAERVAHQSQRSVRPEAAVVVTDNAGRFLAAMLQAMQCQSGHHRRVGHVPYSEDAALLMERIVVGAISGECHASVLLVSATCRGPLAQAGSHAAESRTSGFDRRAAGRAWGGIRSAGRFPGSKRRLRKPTAGSARF